MSTTLAEASSRLTVRPPEESYYHLQPAETVAPFPPAAGQLMSRKLDDLETQIGRVAAMLRAYRTTNASGRADRNTLDYALDILETEVMALEAIQARGVCWLPPTPQMEG